MLKNIFKISTAKLRPWVPEVFLACRGNFRWPTADTSSALGRTKLQPRPQGQRKASWGRGWQHWQNYLRPSQWELSSGRERWGRLFLLSWQLRFARLLAPWSFSRAGSCYISSNFFFGVTWCNFPESYPLTHWNKITLWNSDSVYLDYYCMPVRRLFDGQPMETDCNLKSLGPHFQIPVLIVTW